MHAMVAISILIEGEAVISAFVVAVGGRGSIAIAQAIAYSICAAAVSIGLSEFLSNRSVSNREIWRWLPAGTTAEEPVTPWWRGDWSKSGPFISLLALGAAGGVVLGLFAVGYLAVLNHIPATAQIIRESQEQMAKIPGLRISYALIAIGVAPFAEEYLFRGLLFRALDREWGGWRAVLGSAAFFAIYHPPLSWLPVALLGATNALLFKRTGRLAPAVALHMVYNAIVLAHSL
jgi:membrane protease YdiL (CAAX protease family)